MTNKLLSYLSPIIQVLTLVLVIVIIFSGNLNLGGTTNYDAMDVTDGYLVDASTVINGSGDWTGSGNMTVTGSFIPDAIGSGVNIQTAGTATTTVTAANVCDNSIIEWAPINAVSTSTLPGAVALQADCLDIRGSYRDILWENTSLAASTTAFTAGASTTIEFASSTISVVPLSGADGAIIRFYNSTSTTSNSAMIKIKIIPFQD